MKIRTVMALVVAFIFLSSVSVVSAAPDMAHADSLKELKDQKVIKSTLKTPSEKAKYTFEVTDKIKTDAKSTITVSTEKGKLKLKSNSGKHEVQNLQIAYSLLAPYIVDGAVRVEHKTDSGITDAVWIQKVKNDNGYVYFDNVPFSEIIIGGYTGTYTKTGILNYSVSNVFTLGSTFRANSTNFLNATVTPQYEEDSPYDIPTDGLVGWWKFDEGSGTYVNDSSGNNNNGTYNGNWTTGKYNSAGSFDNDDDVLNLGKPAILDVRGKSEMTYVIHMFKQESTEQEKNIILRHRDTSDAQGTLKIGTDNRLGFLLTTTTGFYTVKSSVAYPYGEYTQLAVTYTGSNIDMYINNNRVAHTPATGTVALVDTYHDFVVCDKVACVLDDLIVYNRSLSENEIKAIYYDSLVDLQLKTNSNTTYSSKIDESGTVNVPHDSEDADITSFTAYVPETVIIGGVTVRDYNRTITPFTLTATVEYTENTTLVSESIANDVYHLNISYTPAVNSTGNIGYTTAELGSYDWLGNIQLDSDDAEAMVSSWNATNFEIQTGNLTAGQTYEYNISVSVYNVPVAEFEATNTIGYHTITTEFTDLSTNSPTSWLWNFGDGSTSTSQNPTHTYAAGGYYTVTLTATNPAGNDVETKTNVIHVIPPVQDTVESSFVDSWQDTMSLVGAIIIVSLAGSAIMVFKGKKSMLDVEYDMQGVVLVLVLMVLGAIIFGQF